jgi:hypothetical protein
MKIKIGDKIKCLVEVTENWHDNPREVRKWEVGIVYHIGKTVLAFETDRGHVYGVKIESVSLA